MYYWLVKGLIQEGLPYIMGLGAKRLSSCYGKPGPFSHVGKHNLDHLHLPISLLPLFFLICLDFL